MHLHIRNLFLLIMALGLMSINSRGAERKIVSAKLSGPTTVAITYADGQTCTLDFYSDRIVRVFQDPKGGPVRDPQATPPAQILVDQPRGAVKELTLTPDGISTACMELIFNKEKGTVSLRDRQKNVTVMKELSPAEISDKGVKVTLQAQPNEYFYGGGVQNGRFSHRGQQISIVNQNSWNDGGVCSPAPFYWSTAGYGMMFHTFKPGQYDFGAKTGDVVTLEHQTDHLDLFLWVADGPVALLNQYYQLTGRPVLLPLFGFYEGHLNAYNRDYWKESENGILFEDGKRYKESQQDNGGIRESLNGEQPGSYQFSARAVIDRYEKHDMPLGWILPNDGYGAGYGQAETLDGNIENLRQFGEYARKKGVEIGLWTQSDLHPVDSIKPLLQRDIEKEIGVAGVRVLKTDVAWVGSGYSFGLNGISKVAGLMPKLGHRARPFIITVNGWAGTQRYGGVWTGDQTGGKWEYIRFHIPTYIGAGLSGMPNISSDMDGIFGGKNMAVNVRDFQWKTFTPMQLNMDGWGANPKYPHALEEPATSINRSYLKLKTIIMPYIYTIAHQAMTGKPMVRAMFLDYPNKYTLGKQTQYQFMCGPSFLVAPVYQDTRADAKGNDIRNGIYLPEGRWYDMFTGKTYEGGCVLNNYDAPIWKLPLFIKAGSILPVTYAHNNPNQIRKNVRSYELFPYGESEFTVYEDDGKTDAYLYGDSATTRICSSLKKGVATITIEPTKGHYEGMVTQKSLTLTFNVSKEPKNVTAKVNGKKVKLQKATSMQDFGKHNNSYFYLAETDLNGYSTPGSPASKVKLPACPVMYVRMEACDITKTTIEVSVKGYEFNIDNGLKQKTGTLTAPRHITVNDTNRTAYSLVPSWQPVDNADYYEIRYDSMIYTGIRDTYLKFEDLQPETEYAFALRAVNRSGSSEWTEFKATTTANPLEFAIRHITATCTAQSQPGEGLHKLFDFDEKTMWHTKWETKATPFEMICDLHSVNVLDRMEYLPRQVGVNGMLLSSKVAYSMDKSHWTEAGNFAWTHDMKKKTFTFKGHPQARYIRLTVDRAYGQFGSGQELYIFRQPGTPSYIPGDVNADNQLDENDLTSYLNYNGLRLGDKDFEGYVSKGDVNGNRLIDAYDISNVAVELEGGAKTADDAEPVAGKLVLVPDKKTYRAGETVTVTVRGFGLTNVNALSFAIPYAPAEYEYLGMEPGEAVKSMRNFTNDRLHSNGQKALYPTFVNVGDRPVLGGSADLFTLRFRAGKAGPFSLQMKDGLLVDKQLYSVSF